LRRAMRTADRRRIMGMAPAASLGPRSGKPIFSLACPSLVGADVEAAPGRQRLEGGQSAGPDDGVCHPHTPRSQLTRLGPGLGLGLVPAEDEVGDDPVHAGLTLDVAGQTNAEGAALVAA